MVVVYDLRVYMCSVCARVHNDLAQCTAHEDAHSDENVVKPLAPSQPRRRVVGGTLNSAPPTATERSHEVSCDNVKVEAVPPNIEERLTDNIVSIEANESASELGGFSELDGDCEVKNKRLLNVTGQRQRRPKPPLDAVTVSPPMTEPQSDTAMEFDILPTTSPKPNKIRKKKPTPTSIITCDKCGDVSHNIADFKLHMQSHESRRRGFMCSYCHKTFQARATLTNHEYIHTGVRPLACRVDGCTKAFIQHTSRNYHEKKHHPNFGLD